MKKNDHPEFVGIPKLKRKHHQQIVEFEHWARAEDWQKFHISHYDWWAFPIDKPSRLGFAYTVFEDEINELKQDPVFMQELVLGAELLLRSWGWDLKRSSHIDHPLPDQDWQNWPIRLHKCASSLLLFGFQPEFESVRKFARGLIHEGVSFAYSGKDLSELFR
ncbi:hypothetical protein [Parabacteroides sp. FAFU027]|uniref:hypothetical protein n=1 Tax=Parabacteroides sp. FAFU027 TaxID=2922715 RepID=UPI001FAE7B3E|nr:hypothetical protein [Parabacteroides sp. FAFU027]